MIPVKNMRSRIEASLKKLESWIEGHHYKGYDPADGLTSYLRPLTFNHLLLDRILLQLVQRSPFNLRPLLGIRPRGSFIGRGYMAAGYLKMFKLTGNEAYMSKAVACLDFLVANKAPAYEHYCWGKLFDFASRFGRYPKFEPVTVWTCLIGHAFLDAYEILQNDHYLGIASSICEWIMALPRTETASGACIHYTAMGNGSCTIHNQSMLAAAMLARTARFNGCHHYLDVARDAVTYTCTRQLPNGAWYYGEAPKYHWIDNFHTGYNLDALKCYIFHTGDQSYTGHLKKGFDFFKRYFVESTGRPRYYHDKTFPIDIQCASQCMETLVNFADSDDTALDWGLCVALWTIDHMQDRSGFFFFRKHPFCTQKVPMIHWGQATMYKALTTLLTRI